MEAEEVAPLSVGIVYFTDNVLRPDIAEACQKQLLRAANGHYILSVSLRPMDFGDANIVLGLERGYVTMFKQILAGVSNIQEDVCFLCENDVIYDESHFRFTPERNDIFFYNENSWRVSAETGHTLFHRRRAVSQLCARTRLLIDHYGDRLNFIEKHGFSFAQGFEPGGRRISHGGIDDRRSDVWFSEKPNIDIRDHGTNVTKTLWKKSDFRNQKHTTGWAESDRVDGWGVTEGRFPAFLKDVAEGRIPM